MDIDKKIIALDCQKHKFIGRDGLCQATDCLVRKNNIEDHPGECMFYRYLHKDKNGAWSLSK